MTRAEQRLARDHQRTLAKLAKAEEERDGLKAAIREHHRQVVRLGNWAADDDLWAKLRLPGRPETRAA